MQRRSWPSRTAKRGEADGARAGTTLVCRPLAAGETLWEDRCLRSREAPFALDPCPAGGASERRPPRAGHLANNANETPSPDRDLRIFED